MPFVSSRPLRKGGLFLWEAIIPLSSGTFTRLYSWQTDSANGINITDSRMDAEFDGIATALSQCLLKDGTQTVTANIPMATYKLTGLGSGSARTDSVTTGQVQDGNLNWVDGGGAADAITASYSPTITALADGQMCCVRATAANATATPTFSPSGLAARTIVKHGGASLSAGDIVGDGHQLLLRYDLANTRWELLNPKEGDVSGPVSSTSGNLVAFSGVGGKTISDSGVSPDTLLRTSNNLSDLASPPTARTNLGLVIGTDVQAHSAELTALAAISGVRGDIIVRDASTWVRLPKGTSGQILTMGANDPAWLTPATSGITLGTSVASTSGTSIDFTSIPSGTKRFSLNFVGVSTSGTSNPLIQLGDSGGIEPSGYLGAGSDLTLGTNYTTGFGIPSGVSANVLHGSIVFSLVNAATNTWCAVGVFGHSNNATVDQVAGSKSLSATLDRVRITTVGGSDTFDAGSINIMYE